MSLFSLSEDSGLLRRIDVSLITITGAEVVQLIDRILGAFQQFGIISEQLAAICNERELDEQRLACRYHLQALFLQGAIQVLRRVV